MKSGCHYRRRGRKESAILRADAVKQQRILEAEGEAQAILAVQKGQRRCHPSAERGHAQRQGAGHPQPTKRWRRLPTAKGYQIIIPSELQNLGSVVPSIKELMTDPKDAE